jgi:aspartate dehydrogenase
MHAAMGIGQRPLSVGLIGLGAVGSEVLRLIRGGGAGSATIVAALVRHVDEHTPDPYVCVVGTSDELIAHSPDVVVEAAGQAAVRAHAEAILTAGIDLLILSVGALADDALLHRLERAAIQGGAQIQTCSGAVAGLDGIASAAVIGLDSVTHTIRKPPGALLDKGEAMKLMRSGGELELYAGPAREATRRFPKNLNAVAAVSFAGLGLDRTSVRLIADAAVHSNIHNIVAVGAFGRLEIRVENVPSDNPKTSRLVAPSVVNALRRYRQTTVVRR